MMQFIQQFLATYYQEVMIALGAVIALLTLLLIIFRFKCNRLRRVADAAVIKAANDKSHYEAETVRMHDETQAAAMQAQRHVDDQLLLIKQESERVHDHYQAASHQLQADALETITQLKADLEPLRKLQGMCAEGTQVQQVLMEALREATDLRAQAQLFMEQARVAAGEERSKAGQKAKEALIHADALLDRATRDAGTIVEEAHKRAEQIGGDAYVALRDKDRLEQAVTAIRNVVDGYGERYVVPTRSIIDDLASDFGHTEAGQTLSTARDQTRRMVEEGQAAACDYVETNRRDTAIRFVIDAFNGRVDAILTRTKHDNFGTLQQEIKDMFALVNLNGKAFRDARILPAYLDARLAELKWAVVVQELRAKEREEQRRIKEQMREEEKARREYERAIQETQKEEDIIKKAIERARLESELASVGQKAQFEAQIAELSQKLTEAEAKNQRAISMAQQTRKGNVYIISNIGSFGEGVFKIGMTRRLEPLDRVRELGDASVPFQFDVHAIVVSDDAPALEYTLHSEFESFRINKVNYRKEFFRLPVDRLRSFFAQRGIAAAFTMAAEAHEYRETQALNKMTPEEKERFHLPSTDAGDDQPD